MRNVFTTLIALFGLTLICETADAFRCGNRIIKEGMFEAEVLSLCGEPVSTRHLGFVLRPYIVRRPSGVGGLRSTRRVYGGYHQEVELTEMLFNFGPHKFMRRLRFEAGQISRIDTAGYGFRE